MNDVMAFHLAPGPRGFGVVSSNGQVIAEGLSQSEALQLVRGDEPDSVKVQKGSGFALHHWPFDWDGRLDSGRWEHYKADQDRKAVRWFAHWQGAGPY